MILTETRIHITLEYKLWGITENAQTQGLLKANLIGLCIFS